MLTVLYEDGFRFSIYHADHEPAHTHVFKSGQSVIILDNNTTKPYVRENKVMSVQNERKALKIAAEKQDLLLVSCISHWRLCREE